MFLSFSFITLVLLVGPAFAELESKFLLEKVNGKRKLKDENTNRRSFYNVEILGSSVRHEDCIVNVEKLDVMFVVDVGASFLDNAIENVKSFIMLTLKPLELDREKVNVGVKSMGSSTSELLTIVQLRRGISHRAVQDGLQTLQKGTGNFDFVAALNDVQESMDKARNISKVVVFVLTSPWISNISAALGSSAMSRDSLYFFYYIKVGAASDGNLQLLHGKAIYEQNYWTLLQNNAVVSALVKQYGCNHCASKPCQYGQRCIPQDDTVLMYRCVCSPGAVRGACDPCISDPCEQGTCYTTGISYTCDPCIPQPCLNDGKCFKLNGTAYCECVNGYVGNHCQYKCPICQNGGECIEKNDRAICRCLDGSISETCECGLLITCLNGGVCDFVNGQPVCRCQVPFYGPTCAQLCDENTCKNGGRCGVENNATICDCPPQFEGKMCELDKCDSYFKCKNGGECEVHASAFHVFCHCVTPFSGVDCSITPCSNYTCLNGGICQLGSGRDAECTCIAPFSGKNCQYHPCDSYSCLNGGTCDLDARNNPMCICQSPFSGYICQITPCSNNPCANGGVCRLDQRFEPICSCPPPYSGDSCQISPCSNYPCQNGGTCQVDSTSYFCQCLAQFSGVRCQNNLCFVNPCLNKGHCFLNSSNYPECECAPSYSGERCQFDSCHNYDCHNGGVCRVVHRRPTCDCPPRFSGDRCQFDPCTSHPCANDGICQLDSNNFATCICRKPFSGKRCQSTPCSENPCRNGGVCQVDFSRNFTCTCPEGYSGIRCEMDPCSNQPCHNGGTCVITDASYRCNCRHGYWGEKCLFNPCSPNPCYHEGICNAVPSTWQESQFVYNCTCTKYFTGPRCTTPVETTTLAPACSSKPCVPPCVCKPSCMHAEGYVCISDDGKLGKTCSIPPPQLQCRSDHITISLDDELMTELQGSEHGSGYFYFAGEEDDRPSSLQCRSVKSSNGLHVLSIPFPFTSCGTSTFVNDVGQVVIANKIWFNVGDGLLYDMLVPVVLVSCNFTSDYNVSISINPMVDENRVSLRRSNQVTYAIDFELCKAVSTCLKTCPSYLGVQPGAVYTVGQFINAIFKPPIVAGRTVDLVDLYVSCGETLQSSSVIDIIKDGCPVADIPSIASTTTTSICVMFQLHRLMGCGVIYLHARLAHCGNSVQLCKDSSQIYRCNDGNARGRRSAGKEVIFGPVFVIQRSRNMTQTLPKMVLESHSGAGDALSGDDGNSLLLIIFGSCLLLVFVCVMISLFLYWSNRKYQS